MSDAGSFLLNNSNVDHSAYTPSSPSSPNPSHSLPAGTLGDLPVLSMNGITCRFNEVIANNDVHLDLFKGEIHGLLGENGAGKTTLMSGTLRPIQTRSGRNFCEGEKG